MKFLFILLLPFLISINSISNKIEKIDRIKCCDLYPKVEKEYLVEDYKLLKSMKVDMAMGHRDRNKVEYTLVADKEDEIKYITQEKYNNIDNLDIILLNARRIPVNCEKKNIDSKRIEMKVTIPQKGIYYLSFVRKDTSNREPICAAALMFKKQKHNTPNEKELQQKIQNSYKK
ncbi:hypothetical protein ACE193_00085 [Bernardetia sp. OM2101]|uniref:hypothetical protein n=1 Tax=Bernardetia sp. OM2101 TaxID=3344876 RepID=UPI0035D06F74